MSTRATISVSDGNDRFDIYRHHDGYPDGPHGVIRSISKAQDLSWGPSRFEAGEFAAALVAVMKTTAGSVYLTASAEAHGDRRFHYEVTGASGQIRIAVQQSDWGDLEKTFLEMRSIFEGCLSEAVTRFQTP